MQACSEKFFASLVCPRLKGAGLALKDRLKQDEIIELQEFILQGSLQCSDVVKTCNWPAKHDNLWGGTRDCCEMFQPVFTNYGLCFAFNSLPLNGMTNETLPWQQWLSPNLAPAGLQWGLDVGYPKVFPPDLVMQPLRVMVAGEVNGLSLELYLNSSEHQFSCEGNSLGFTILISAPTDHLYTSTVMRIPMNRMTTVEVSPITYKTDPTLRSLAPYKRQCFFQSERRLEYYNFYTDTNCQHDLLIREAKEMCDCVLYNWPRKNIWDQICSTDRDFQCINEVNAKVEEQLIYAYYEDSEEQGKAGEGTKSCHPSCNDIIYSSQVFYSDLIREHGDGSPSWGNPRHGEVTIVNVHFYEDLFLGQHRHAQYDDYYFAGAIGGLLSLFLGFSIISVAELVYFVFLRPFYIILKEIRRQH
ncbi:hypothetical protein O3G_MSEX001229 [Manduca sexta]|uniref:Uncharacterized protein n=1 Tax=Manduca sexta TaxID=7130 RepID=A0A921YJI2_MANSE|nr:hypothetical protein O3G_MSEX001229 [Manduca sexta]